MILQLNGVTLQYSQKELINLGLAIASNKAAYDEILEWIQQRNA